MGLRHGGFGRTETRSSALWGSGNGGGDKRRSLGAHAARIAVAPLVVLAAVTPLAASAHDAPSASPSAYIAPLLERAAAPRDLLLLHVIVRSESGLSAARKAVQSVGTTDQRLPIADAVSANVTGTDLAELANTPGLVVTPDALVTSITSATVALRRLWINSGSDRQPARLQGRRAASPTIAIVDSEYRGRGAVISQKGRKSRVLKQVTLTTLIPNSPGDGRGHGTFVAGLAAGDARDYAGAAPSANLVSLDVMDDNGMARTSDVIAAANWILNNKGAVQHQGRELLAPFEHPQQLHARPAGQGCRATLAERRSRRHLVGQLRERERAERRALRTRERSIRGHGQTVDLKQSFRRAGSRCSLVVGVRLHA